MNERIFELMSQAGMAFESNTERVVTREEALKFAELIVRECAVPMITQARTMDAHGGYKNNPIEVTAMNLHQGLLKHFGVEE